MAVTEATEVVKMFEGEAGRRRFAAAARILLYSKLRKHNWILGAYLILNIAF